MRHLCQVVGDVRLVVGQSADRVIPKVQVLKSHVPEPLERGELEKLLETSQSIIGEVYFAQGPSEREPVSDLGQSVAAQPQLFESFQGGQSVHLQRDKQSEYPAGEYLHENAYTGVPLQTREVFTSRTDHDLSRSCTVVDPFFAALRCCE